MAAGSATVARRRARGRVPRAAAALRAWLAWAVRGNGGAAGATQVDAGNASRVGPGGAPTKKACRAAREARRLLTVDETEADLKGRGPEGRGRRFRARRGCGQRRCLQRGSPRTPAPVGGCDRTQKPTAPAAPPRWGSVGKAGRPPTWPLGNTFGWKKPAGRLRGGAAWGAQGVDCGERHACARLGPAVQRGPNPGAAACLWDGKGPAAGAPGPVPCLPSHNPPSLHLSFPPLPPTIPPPLLTPLQPPALHPSFPPLHVSFPPLPNSQAERRRTGVVLTESHRNGEQAALHKRATAGARRAEGRRAARAAAHAPKRAASAAVCFGLGGRRLAPHLPIGAGLTGHAACPC
jgi:hypothetical protein